MITIERLQLITINDLRELQFTKNNFIRNDYIQCLNKIHSMIIINYI